MLKSAASNRSKMPPCPGKRVPLSFTMTVRFNKDSNKSPKIDVSEIRRPETPQKRREPCDENS
jgi:hypothetical protein